MTKQDHLGNYNEPLFIQSRMHIPTTLQRNAILDPNINAYIYVYIYTCIHIHTHTYISFTHLYNSPVLLLVGIISTSPAICPASKSFSSGSSSLPSSSIGRALRAS